MKQPMKLRSIASLTLLGMGLPLLSIGCDDAQETGKPTTQPVPVVKADQPGDSTAMVAAYPMRPPAIFTIDGRDVAFPAARIAIVSHRGGLTLRLFSDDPPTAIDPGYLGNSFSFDMRLPIDRAEDLANTSWDHKPADADDSGSGIFVHGIHDGLRPYNVHITFQKTDGQLSAYVDGFFLHDDPQNPIAAPTQVHASGSLRLGSVE
jgi:hypothetical protein